MTHKLLATGLGDFISSSPTPFHAVQQMLARLQKAGYQHLSEQSSWDLKPGGRYCFTRNDSSLVALRLGNKAPADTGIRMVGAHTDSPCLKIKPQPEIRRNGYLQLGVEVYGGALLNPWFDRDLSMAGRVVYADSKGQLQTALVDFRDPVAFIPSLAIHLDREVNQKRSINAQTDLPPLLLQEPEGAQQDFKSILRSRLRQQYPDLDIVSVVDHEISLYDVQAPSLTGLQQDFIAAARLDNLLSCFAGMEALLASDAQASKGDGNVLLVCTDHEEVGSATAAGASGPFLASVLSRVAEVNSAGQEESRRRMLAASFLVSVDNAHAIHPNFADKHDVRHGPLMNGGPVIKYNANQRYATTGKSAALFRQLCNETQVPCQSFAVRSDMGCGSTIGPLLATELGVDTVDIGVPTLGMHSIRELAGSRDVELLHRVLTHYFSGP
jgi:aspartyl aminopeptidase